MAQHGIGESEYLIKHFNVIILIIEIISSITLTIEKDFMSS